MYGLETKLHDQLLLLRNEFGLKGIKAEFEAEGSSFRDLVRLRRITCGAGVGLYLKIGGVEAVRDVKDALEIGVEGLIAPMVESPFGVAKFVEACRKVLGEHRVHLSINIETRSAVEGIDEILERAKGEIDNVTVGRSDLSRSFFDETVTPDSDFILGMVEGLGEKIKKAGMSMTMGGGITARTVEKLRKRETLTPLIERLETRKVILPTEVMLSSEEALLKALKFEELYILSKKEFSDNSIRSEIARLTELQRRL